MSLMPLKPILFESLSTVTSTPIVTSQALLSNLAELSSPSPPAATESSLRQNPRKRNRSKQGHSRVDRSSPKVSGQLRASLKFRAESNLLPLLWKLRPQLSEYLASALLIHAQRFFWNDPARKTRARGPMRKPFHTSDKLPHLTRLEFEQKMLINGADEGYSPRIHVNNDEDDEACPKDNFFWTDKMWYGEGVPYPMLRADVLLKRRRSSNVLGFSASSTTSPNTNGEDTKKPHRDNQFSSELVGCECAEDECDPFACACAKLQAAEIAGADLCLAEESPIGFMFHEEGTGKPEGTLKQSGIRIIECNDLCRCSVGCSNRVGSTDSTSIFDDCPSPNTAATRFLLQVTQFGRGVEVDIQKTRHKGWGTC